MGKRSRAGKSVLGAMVEALKAGEISPPEAVEVAAGAPTQEEAVEQLQEVVANKAEELAQEIAQLEAALAPTSEAPKAAGPILHVKPGVTLRGGRGEWYKLLRKYDGKPVAEFVAEGTANPASRYTARSTKCGQPKTPESRLSWFKRAGIVTIK
jgi:hypothetical protein